MGLGTLILIILGVIIYIYLFYKNKIINMYLYKSDYDILIQALFWIFNGFLICVFVWFCIVHLNQYQI